MKEKALLKHQQSSTGQTINGVKMKYEITYGSKKITINIDDSFLINDQPFITPKKVDLTNQMKNIHSSIKNAIENPPSNDDKYF